MAGPMTDQQLQQLLESTTPCAMRFPQASEAVTVAWAGLKNDLLAGGWTDPHMQAGIACPATSPAADPGELQVTIMWAASRPVTGPTDRHLATISVTPVGNSWRVKSLT